MTKQALKKMLEGTKEERVFLAEHSFGLFCIYYFDRYFKYQLAPYHYDFFQDCHDLVDNKIREVAWIAFRESGKTSIAKLFVIWMVCYKKRSYLNVDSFDKENAERILFDVAFELVNNQRLQADYGILFAKSRGIDEIKQNRISNFVTENGIRVEAHSTQESVRGRLHLNQRPDCLILDDIETNKTKDSQAYSKQVADHISEAMAGMSVDGFMLYLGNYITEAGNVQNLFDRAKIDEKIRMRNIPVIIDDAPAWTAKYVMTDAEVGDTGKVSIESKQVQLGSLVFSYEMMNQPIDEMLAEFKKQFVQTEVEQTISQLDTACYITIDSAVSEKESADYTGVTINRVSKDNKWYIKTYRLKVNSKELIDHIFFLHQTYTPNFIGLEETTFTMAIQPFIEDEMRKRAKFFVVTPVKHQGTKKETRIRGLIPRWESKSIFLVGDNIELLDEMRVFPNGQHDDCIAEGSLVLTERGQVPIEQITIRDRVMTRGGLQKVLKVWDKGSQPIISNLGILGTSEHKVITVAGEKALCFVDQSDILYIWNEKLLCIEEKSIIDTLSLRGDNTESTTGVIFPIIPARLHYTDKSGLIQMGRYLKAFTSTIKTKIHLITTLITWNLYQHQIMLGITQASQIELKNKENLLQKTMLCCKRQLKSGEIVRREKSGTVSILKKVLISLKKLSVPSVAQKQSVTQPTVNIALQDVETKFNLETTVSSTPTLEKRRVYDLMVENHHEFFVNNILVHNCIDSLSMQLPHARAPFRKPMKLRDEIQETNMAI